jgi:hypothetical protein
MVAIPHRKSLLIHTLIASTQNENCSEMMVGCARRSVAHDGGISSASFKVIFLVAAQIKK